jgi:hypothetical protein
MLSGKSESGGNCLRVFTGASGFHSGDGDVLRRNFRKAMQERFIELSTSVDIDARGVGIL